MIKEIILAIILGGLLGFGATGGYLALQSKNNPQNNQQITVEPTVNPDNQDNSSPSQNDQKLPINITSPQENDLVSSDKINISGNTSANSQIIINTTSNTFMGQSDQNGQFNIPIELDSGLNVIKISAIDSEDNQFDSQINITYSSAKI